MKSNFARPPALLVVAILVVSAVLRIYSIGTESYWVDEMVSLHFASHSDWRAVFWDNAPILYHALLKFWVLTAGDLEATTRLLSAVFSLAATGLMILIGTRLAGALGGVMFGFLHAVSALSITYGQETRMYAMLEFLTALNFYAWLRLTGGERAEKLFFTSAILMILTHYLAVIPLTLECGLLAWANRADRERLKSIALVLTVTLLLGAISFAAFFSWRHLHWQTVKFGLEPRSRLPIDYLWFLANKSAVAGLALVLLGAWSLKEARKRGNWNLWIMFLVPLMLLTGAGLVLGRATLLPRYLIFLTPVFIALTGLALTEILNGSARSKYAGAGVLAIFLSGTIGSFDSIYADTKASWRDAAAVISRFPGSLVLTTKTGAIESPYFKNSHIPLRRWSTKEPEEILHQASLNDYVWIVDTYWNMKEIWSSLEPLLDGKVQVKNDVLKRGDREALYLIQIRKNQ